MCACKTSGLSVLMIFASRQIARGSALPFCILSVVTVTEQERSSVASRFPSGSMLITVTVHPRDFRALAKLATCISSPPTRSSDVIRKHMKDLAVSQAAFRETRQHGRIIHPNEG